MFIPYLRLGDTGNEGPEILLYRTLMIFSYYVILPLPKPVVKYNNFIKDLIQLERGMNFSATEALMRNERRRQRCWGRKLLNKERTSPVAYPTRVYSFCHLERSFLESTAKQPKGP